MTYGNIPLPPVGTLHSTASTTSTSTSNTESTGFDTTSISKTQTKTRIWLTSLKQRFHKNHSTPAVPQSPYSLAALRLKQNETRGEEEIYLNDPHLVGCMILRNLSPINLRLHPITSLPELMQNFRVAQKTFFAFRAKIDDFFSDLKLMPLRKGGGEREMLLDSISCLKFYEMCWMVIIGFEYSKNNWVDAAKFLAGDLRKEIESATEALIDGLRERRQILQEEREENALYAQRVGDEARLALKLREMKG